MILLCLLGMLVPATGDDTYTLTLVFQRMHCEECKREAESTVKRLPGFVAVSFLETAAVVIIADKSPLPAVAGLPKDMGYRGARLAIPSSRRAAGRRSRSPARSSWASSRRSSAARTGSRSPALSRGSRSRWSRSRPSTGRTEPGL
jgi:hypothetical protein